MSYRRLTHQVLTALVAGSLVPAMFAAGLVVAVPAQVQAAAKRASCRIHAVHVEKEGDGTIPADLKFIEDQLKDDQFAAYKGFRLLDTRTLKLELNKPKTASMKTAHRVKLAFLGSEQRRLKLHATLLARGSDKELVSTEYAIEDNGVLMIGGSKHGGGRLFFAIQCASRG